MFGCRECSNAAVKTNAGQPLPVGEQTELASEVDVYLRHANRASTGDPDVRVVFAVLNKREEGILTCAVGHALVLAGDDELVASVIRIDEPTYPHDERYVTQTLPVPSGIAMNESSFTVVWWPTYLEFSDGAVYRAQPRSDLDVTGNRIDWWACRQRH